MAYYIATRKLVVRETVIIKADSRHEAFIKASEDEDCIVTKETEDEYETDFSSVMQLDYISEATKQRIG